MRKRRRTKYTWLPQIGTQADTNPEDDNVGFSLPALNIPIISGAVGPVFITAVIPDAPNDTPVTGVDTLADFVANEYFLKRIVGKLYWESRPQGVLDLNAPFSMVLGAGFFIARADELTSNQPIGVSTIAEAQSNYGPLGLANTREPWIWRRTWYLDAQDLTTVNPPTRPAITSTMAYNSVMDGPHIDAKTARRVRQDERLFFALQAANADPIDRTVTVTTGTGWLDIRLLGALRKARNRSAF